MENNVLTNLMKPLIKSRLIDILTSKLIRGLEKLV